MNNFPRNLLPVVILRNTIRLYARKRRVPNPGMQKRLNVLSEKQQDNDFDDEDFEELESDFMNVGEAQKEHEREVMHEYEKRQYMNVKRKYFKEDNVNFLSWNDKEQIRFLYNTNRKEWTIEKLSEGFPALPETISKIVSGKWQPKTEMRRKKHDASVENNWRLLKQGKLTELPKRLLEHVTTFSNRKSQIPIMPEKTILNEKRTVGEFASIIEKYNRLINEKMAKQTRDKLEPIIELENKHTTVKDTKRKGIKTLSDLRKDIEEDLSQGRNVDEYDKMILTDALTPSVDKKIEYEPVSVRLSNSTYVVEKNNDVSENVDKKIFEALSYPEQITIPKNKFRRGFTYKVRDCFYDDDGKFLYRVPGMI